MSDQKLRELERRWKETGSTEDEAAYLLERVRVGDLTRERLELAAYCGHEGARKATSAQTPAPVELSDLFRVLRQNDPVFLQLALSAVGSAALAIWPPRQVNRGALESAISHVEALARCPCASHQDELLHCLDLVSGPMNPTLHFAQVVAYSLRADTDSLLGSIERLPNMCRGLTVEECRSVALSTVARWALQAPTS
jgi:hypothetical protein